MSQALALANGWSLAISLMVSVVIFQSGAGDYGVMPSDEYDGDPDAILHEYDPWGIM